MCSDPHFPNLTVVDHPLVQHKLSIMRHKETSTNVFRQLLKEITLLMGYELTRDLPLTHRRIDTPVATMEAQPWPARSRSSFPFFEPALA